MRVPRRSHSISSTHWNRPIPILAAIPVRAYLAMAKKWTFPVFDLGHCLATLTSSST
ncbi:hypothetical protein AzCIB_1430 [Azoarcus sp. CIB]|nr:hypothetical protein AzCIB_1430 [Azoarcus sp. CIB]